MTNQPKLSKRANAALNVLADGGRFVLRLERNRYTGYDKFQHRLLAKGAGYSGYLRGYGHATFHELDAAGFLIRTDEGTSVSTYYKLRTEG